MENKDLFVTKHEKRNDIIKDSYQNLLNGIGNYWGPFYRENPHRFVLDYLQINIHPVQQFLIYELDKSEQSTVIATRGRLLCPTI